MNVGFAAFFKERNWMPFLAGAFASLTYITVLMAMNYVTNGTYVQIFRQSGLLFGVAFGVLILKEKALLPRIAGAIALEKVPI